jgi:hypothetical protein
MFSGISGAGDTLKSCFDDKGYYTNHNVIHAVKWSEEIETRRGSMNYESIDGTEKYDLKYVAGIVNSKLINYYFGNFLATGTLQGSYSGVYPENIRQFPIRSVEAQPEQESRQQIRSEVESYPSQEGANPREFVRSLNNRAEREQATAHHDGITEATRQIILLKQKHADLNLSLPDHLGTYTDGPTLSEIGLTQPPEDSADSILRQTAAERPNLRVGRCEVVRESASTVEIRLTARYKPDESGAHGDADADSLDTDRWGYAETDPLPALRVTDLASAEADLIVHFVPHAVEEAGGFAGFRETATQTNSLVDRLRGLTLPRLADVREGLESYVETRERAAELDERIARTDELIDEVVYDLYGLSEAERAVVEDAVGA